MKCSYCNKIEHKFEVLVDKNGKSSCEECSKKNYTSNNHGFVINNDKNSIQYFKDGSWKDIDYTVQKQTIFKKIFNFIKTIVFK